MTKRRRGLVIIGYCLSLLYLSSILLYLGASEFPPFRNFALIYMALFAVLFISALAVTRIKEWGRNILVAGNALTFLFTIVVWQQFADFIQPAYLYIHLIVLLYFNQPKIRTFFKPIWQLARKSILVVDDDEVLLRTVQKILLPNGYSVLSATTGEKGLQVANLQRPDLIILDVILPGIKGRDVCIKLKEEDRTRDIPVVFLTAKDSPDDIAAEKEAGALTHMTKPVNAKALLSTVKSILDEGFDTPPWRILVVDDDKVFLKMIKATFSAQGMTVYSAVTGEEGLEKAFRRKPDLIVLDVILPKMKGREVCRKLKEDSRTRDIPVIFLTVKDSQDDIEAEREAGAVTHITKPVDFRLLHREIKGILGS